MKNRVSNKITESQKSWYSVGSICILLESDAKVSENESVAKLEVVKSNKLNDGPVLRVSFYKLGFYGIRWGK